MPQDKPFTDAHLRTRARRLRQNATVPERLLWARLRGGRLRGIKFRRQHPLGSYVTDFYCEAARLVVEVDGLSHVDRVADAYRQAEIESRGLCVVRVTNDDVLADADAVAEYIGRAALARMAVRDRNPHPSPLPKGEGAKAGGALPKGEGAKAGGALPKGEGAKAGGALPKGEGAKAGGCPQGEREPRHRSRGGNNL